MLNLNNLILILLCFRFRRFFVVVFAFVELIITCKTLCISKIKKLNSYNNIINVTLMRIIVINNN